MEDEIILQEPVGEGVANPETDASAEEEKHVAELCERIRADKAKFEDKFKRMRTDMKIARTGACQGYNPNYYKANITGRHINQSVSALYAKNPKATARRRPRMDFRVWDETQESLLVAMQMAQTAVPISDPMTGQPVADPMTGQPVYDPMTQQAIDIIQDFQQGMQARENVKRIGKTLEILFEYFTKEQTPVDFKTSMKQLVRRAKTTSVGYIEIGFQREFGENESVAQGLADFTEQVRHTQLLIEKLQEEGRGDSAETEDHLARKAELEASIRSMEEQREVLIREGLVFDFPMSTRVIPDSATQQLVGFVGARWITIESMYSPDDVRKIFKVDLKKGEYTGHADNGKEDEGGTSSKKSGGELESTEKFARVWKHYDRASGSVYYLCDGYKRYLRPPAPPDVYVEEFWPVYALTFNAVEDENELFPPSDVELMEDMQKEYNDARQGKREHRQAARPRFITKAGMIDDESKRTLSLIKPFEMAELNTDEEDIRKVLAAVPVPGVDPNLYDTNEIMSDIQLTIGAQEANFGAVSKATATESSIAEGSRVAGVDSHVDDLDAFLIRIAGASGQIMLREMSLEMVQEIAGPGAVWPEASLEDVAKEIYLEIEAGSSGKPNQAQEIKNWKEMLPFLVQMPGIKPEWLARESLRRLDDRMDLTEALSPDIPAIVAQNRMSQPAPGDPGADPTAQGGEGANNGPSAPGGPVGTDAPMGNNQV